MKRSFQLNLFFSVGGLFLLFAACFAFYQYTREKSFKIDIMQSRLQANNYELLQTLGDSICSARSLCEYVNGHHLDSLRITVIDCDGRVLADSRQSDVLLMGNHLKRLEVRRAMKNGTGYDIKRESETTNEAYFYSATRLRMADGRCLVIRSAVPYSAALTKSLETDHTYLYFSLLLTLLLGLVLYHSTKRIGNHILYLREFAQKAEKGVALDRELERKVPADELGDISHTIITLYWKLRNSEDDKQRLKRQLTQNSAHELKTPAASIHGYLETIIQNPDLPEDKRRHFLERCHAQSDRMCRLLQDMTTLTKLDEMESAARREHPAAQVDVRQVIENVLDDTSLQLQSKRILATLSLPDNVRVTGDQNLIYSIFRNLIDNAIAYAMGATKISILCAEAEAGEDRYYEFTVSDNGCGVSPEHLPHLFERFYRIDKGRSRKMGGTGLGLAIVKNSVAVHGGTAVAELTPGGGLTIRFTLAC